jgi:hypothetical protein
MNKHKKCEVIASRAVWFREGVSLGLVNALLVWLGWTCLEVMSIRSESAPGPFEDAASVGGPG